MEAQMEEHVADFNTRADNLTKELKEQEVTMEERSQESQAKLQSALQELEGRLMQAFQLKLQVSHLSLHVDWANGSPAAVESVEENTEGGVKSYT
jgi:hypothetical protein